MNRVFTDSTKTTEVKIGDVINVRGTAVEVVAILPLGTIKVTERRIDRRGRKFGKSWAISGLAFESSK